MSEKVLKLENKEAPKVKITNFMIEQFEQNKSFIKLRRLELDPADKGKFYRMAEILLNGPEARALGKLKDDLIKATAFKNEQIKKIEEKEQLTLTHPKVMEILNLETGLEVEKLILHISKLAKDFTPEDMIITSWLVEYVDDTKEDKS